MFSGEARRRRNRSFARFCTRSPFSQRFNVASPIPLTLENAARDMPCIPRIARMPFGDRTPRCRQTASCLISSASPSENSNPQDSHRRTGISTVISAVRLPDPYGKVCERQRVATGRSHSKHSVCGVVSGRGRSMRRVAIAKVLGLVLGVVKAPAQYPSMSELQLDVEGWHRILKLDSHHVCSGTLGGSKRNDLHVVPVVQLAGYELPGAGLGKDIMRRIELRFRVSDLLRPPIDWRCTAEDCAATPWSPGEVRELAPGVVGDAHRSVPGGAGAMTSGTIIWVGLRAVNRPGASYESIARVDDSAGPRLRHPGSTTGNDPSSHGRRPASRTGTT